MKEKRFSWVRFTALTAASAALLVSRGGVSAEVARSYKVPGKIGTKTGVVGPTCEDDDPSSLCLGVKYVVYNDPNHQPVVSQPQAVKNIKSINSLWEKCGISFQIDRFISADPARHQLDFDTANDSDLHAIRQGFDDNKHLLVVTTGPWNRDGSLGNTGANAWTSMPGEGVYGVVLESPVGEFSNIIAHELGHYLNLDHVYDEADLMNPVIYDSSSDLSPDQCAVARETASRDWARMLR